MPARLLHATVPNALRGERLDVVALELLQPEVSRSRLQSWIKEGCLRVNQEVERRPGLVVEGGWKLELLPPAPEVPEPGSPLEPGILYEDEVLAVLDKPSGLPMHGNSPGDARSSVATWLTARYGPGLPIVQGADRPGVVHRLDRETSGVCVVARDPGVFADLMGQFADRSVQKHYLALCYGRPRFRSDRVDLRLMPDPQRPNRQRTTRSEAAHTRDAQTFWEVAELFEGFALIAVKPETGRRHQVRAHLAAIDLPVIGDPLYRAKNYGPGLLPEGAPQPERTLLHAWRLSFQHPMTGERMEFEAPLPEDFAALRNFLHAHCPPTVPLA